MVKNNFRAILLKVTPMYRYEKVHQAYMETMDREWRMGKLVAILALFVALVGEYWLL